MRNYQGKNIKARKSELKSLIGKEAYNLLDEWEKQLVQNLLSSKTIWIEEEKKRKRETQMIRAYGHKQTRLGLPFEETFWKYDILNIWFQGDRDSNMAVFLNIAEDERREDSFYDW